MNASTLIDNIRESFGRVVYTHKTHEKTADQIASKVLFLKWAELVLIVLTTGSAINVLLGAGTIYEITSAILASLALLINIYQFRFNPEQLIQDHRACAKKLWYVREKYIALISDICDNAIDSATARQKRDALAQEVYSIYENAPATNSKAYYAASKALKVNEEMTFSDKEIDEFLPTSMRKIK